MIQILGEDLARVISNTMKFVNPASIYLPGELLFDLTSDRLSCYACDDYVALTDSCELSKNDSKSEQHFVLSLEDVKDLEKFARENKKTDIGISAGYSSIEDETVITFQVNEVDSKEYSTGEFRESNWDLVDMMLFEQLPRKPFDALAFRPERFTKFSQLKHDKEAPMKWQLVDAAGIALVRFTIGNTIVGAIRPLTLEDNE
jgi:hypothetical protein